MRYIRAACTCAVLPAFLTGCLYGKPDLIRDGSVQLRTEPSKNVVLTGVSARQEGDQLVVSGSVRRRGLPSAVLTGHVDLTLVGPDGKPIQEVAKAYTPSNIPQRGPRQSYFTARFVAVPVEGTTIRLRHHGGSRKHEPS